EVDMNYYKTETNLDKEFDQTVEKHLPKWVLIIIDFFNKIFNRFIGDKTVQNTIIKARKAVNGFYNTISNKQIFKSRKFFAFKSPP
ncbi:MAG: hypothetical protein P1U41_07140, partial [Vicingaceae bacterium]|nr:hypothetical protein [Vicingaceae bacterium]